MEILVIGGHILLTSVQEQNIIGLSLILDKFLQQKYLNLYLYYDE